MPTPADRTVYETIDGLAFWKEADAQAHEDAIPVSIFWERIAKGLPSEASAWKIAVERSHQVFRKGFDDHPFMGSCDDGWTTEWRGGPYELVTGDLPELERYACEKYGDHLRGKVWGERIVVRPVAVRPLSIPRPTDEQKA